MAVRKQCKAKGCTASPRCDHPWWFDVMHQGKRYRMPVDAFALVCGATQPVSSKQEAEKVWEPKFIGEIVAGRDPRKPPAPPVAEGMTVAGFLDHYYERYVVAESLRSVASIRSRLAALKDALGTLPVSALERTDTIEDFKREYGKTRSLVAVNRTQLLKRRRFLGPKAFVFGAATGEYQGTIRTAWESPVLLANGIEPTRTRARGRVNRDKLAEIDLHWHDLRHEAACRWLAKGLDLRAIQLLLGHADLKTTQRYLNVTDEELRTTMAEKLWNRG